MPSVEIQSVDFRRLARLNCYVYGPFCIYSDSYVSLDSHNMPNYQTKDGVGAVEKFLSLVQSLGANASGNDPSQKLAKPLPGVGWNGDDLTTSISLSGKMYFTDFRDWQVCKKAIRKELVSQGWKQNKNSMEKAGISVLTYIPNNSGHGALYNDDPIDAAGFAMMTSAMQNTSIQMNKLSARFGLNRGDSVTEYNWEAARYDSRQAINQKKHPTLSKLGAFGSDIGAGIEAFGANMNSGMVAKWRVAGHPVELQINGVAVSKSVNGIMTSVRLTEKAFVIDASSDKSVSGNSVYPTEMDVELNIKNMYGSLITTSRMAGTQK